MAFKVVDDKNINDFKNFKYHELKCKCGGKYCNGYPTGFSYDLLTNLQKARDYFGKAVIITSPLRCARHNSNVGGVKNSKHTLGRAVDFYVKGVSYSKLKAYMDKLPYKNYIYNVSGSVMHYDINPPEWIDKYNLTRLLKSGCRGEDVKELQRELKKRGYDLGKYGPNKDGIDGVFGKSNSKTSNAVRQFQRDSGLKVDAKVGKNTAHALGWLYKGK